MTVTADGLKRTNDGKLFVTIAGSDGSSTPAGAPGFATLMAQSFAAVSGAADTNENALATVTIPANTLGANGALFIETHWAFTNNANTKTLRLRFSGIGGTAIFSQGATTQQTGWARTMMANRGVTNSQFASSIITYVGNTIGNSIGSTAAIDTTAATTLVISGQKATAGDTLTLEGYSVWCLRP